MLKRPRPSSPPLSTSSIPFVEDPFPLARRVIKRRRVMPPSLDGKSRGWATVNDLEEDEEYISNDEKHVECGGDGSVATAEYKTANIVLHELHTLHQHRLLFASLHPQGSQLSRPQHLSDHTQSIHHEPRRDDGPSKTIAKLHYENSDGLLSTHPNIHPSVDELHRVTQRYEDTNRLLGSLFLSRRRQLGVTDNGS